MTGDHWEPASVEGGLPTRQILAVAVGNGLEFYDFVTYAFFAAPIGRTWRAETRVARGREGRQQLPTLESR